MDDQTAHLPAVIVRFDHPPRLTLYLASHGPTAFRTLATRYATHSAARRAIHKAICDLRLDAWTPSLETA